MADTPQDQPVENTAPVETSPLADEPKVAEEAILQPPNFEVTSEWTSTGAKHVVGVETVDLPSANTDVLQSALENAPDNIGTSDEAARWAASLSESTTQVFPNDGGVEAARRKDAKWSQELASDVGPLRGAVPKIVKREGQTYTGEAAVSIIRSRLKLGTNFQVPLWSSGFWVTITSPTEDELLELQRRIAAEKISAGRQTYGLMFSNTKVYITNILLEFIMDHIHRYSVDVRKDELVGLIKTTDMSQLIWGLASSIWPNGFQYRRACIADVSKCTHVIEEKLSLPKLSWVDRSCFTPSMTAHMARRGDKGMSLDSVKRFQEEMLRGQQFLAKLDDDLSVTFKIPAISEELTSGFRWINTMEELYGKSMSMDEQVRDSYLLDQTRATIMREYAHCVQALHVDGDDYTDTDAIENILAECSSRDDLRTAFKKEIGKYLDSSLVSLIAIPSYTCPKCGTHQVVEGFQYPELIPIDVGQTFFSLLGQRIQKIQTRDLITM